MTPNWIPDTNRFSLAGPPNWFLKQLWEFDNSLVLVPSRQGFFYRLAQRRPIQLSTAIVSDVMREQADTAMLVTYGLVPVTTVLATVRWDNPAIFEQLRARAPWRMGGADEYEKKILEQERREELAKAAAQDDMTSQLAKDSWKYYQQKQGLRTHLWSPSTKSPASPAASSSAAVIVPRQTYRPTLQTAWGDVLRRR